MNPPEGEARKLARPVNLDTDLNYTIGERLATGVLGRAPPGVDIDGEEREGTGPNTTSCASTYA
ncbi:MAG: hypothetical protein WBB42_06865 [Polyangiales bacterium]